MPIKAVKPIRDEPELIDTRAIEAEMAKHTQPLSSLPSPTALSASTPSRLVSERLRPTSTHHSPPPPPLTTRARQALPSDLVLCEYGGPRLCDKNRSRFLKGDYALQIPTTSTFIDGTYYCYPGLYARNMPSAARCNAPLSLTETAACVHCFVVLRAAPPLHCNAPL